MVEDVALHNGEMMPAIGFGTWKLKGDLATDSVVQALRTGYRLIDTAAIYNNEKFVGRAIKDSGVNRDDIFLTTKVWNDDLGYQLTVDAFHSSLKSLGLDYIDLYLIHWPLNEKLFKSWDAMIMLQKQGYVKNIGVSNFTAEQLREIKKYSDIKPVVNQVQFNPDIYHDQEDLLAYCDENDIVIEAYSPLAQSDLVDESIVKGIANDLDKTPAQVLIRWAIEHDTVPIPKSGNPDHIKSNFEVFDFELSPEQIEKLNNIQSDGVTLYDPEDEQ